MDGFFEYLHRFWSDLVSRADGPMTFRLYLQPLMAFIAALHDGVKDARLERSPYLVRLGKAPRTERLQTFRESTTAVSRVLILGVVMDVIYQLRMFGGFRYPLESFVVAVVLALVPYLLLRGPVARAAAWWAARKKVGGG